MSDQAVGNINFSPNFGGNFNFPIQKINELDKYKFPRKATYKNYDECIVYGFYQIGNLEGGCDPVAVVEFIETGKIDTVNPDNLTMIK